MALLKDTFGRVHTYLRISLTEKCNLRCVYCMPEEGVPLLPKDSLLTRPEIHRLVKVFAGLGVKKVRLTGGEPLVRRDVVDICKDISTTPGIQQLCMTTNGITLSRNLDALVGAGLSHVNISLDTFQEGKFMIMTRRKGHDRVLDAIHKSLKKKDLAGNVKVNCVIMKGVNDDEISSFVDFTKENNVEVRFIEFMPFDDNKWSRQKMISFMEIMDRCEQHVGKKLSFAGNSETAKVFQVPGYAGRLGFITSMTSHFCGSCNRLRLTAEGDLKTCLFGDDEYPLRQLLRDNPLDDGPIIAALQHGLSKKRFSHGGRESPEDLAKHKNRPMITIGG
eukprot:PhF_6_TR2608/c0_g1_i1/m.4405/K20967/MOCS1; GTP 3',8-cyclase / cyclic pyranopterin monophosphate synthase